MTIAKMLTTKIKTFAPQVRQFDSVILVFRCSCGLTTNVHNTSYNPTMWQAAHKGYILATLFSK